MFKRCRVWSLSSQRRSPLGGSGERQRQNPAPLPQRIGEPKACDPEDLTQALLEFSRGIVRQSCATVVDDIANAEVPHSHDEGKAEALLVACIQLRELVARLARRTPDTRPAL